MSSTASAPAAAAGPPAGDVAIERDEAVLARFEAERQALAMMDHPNIAKVLDAGTTESGRPYFVMDLVKGLPITKYCDENDLSTEDRL